MKLQINGEERSFNDGPAPLTLAALIEALGMKPDRVAVERNRNIVPRDRWAETQLQDGDRVEVVHFVGGGATL
jgi:sulfur carrier protein